MTTTHWFYLIAARVFKIGWPLGLKLSAIPSYKILGPIIAVISMAISGILIMAFS
jgi:quaternary ammonium compound-resistance protein SugE